MFLCWGAPLLDNQTQSTWKEQLGLIRVRSGHARFLLYRTSYWGVINLLSLWLLISGSLTMSTEIHTVYIILILYKKDEIKFMLWPNQYYYVCMYTKFGHTHGKKKNHHRQLGNTYSKQGQYHLVSEYCLLGLRLKRVWCSHTPLYHFRVALDGRSLCQVLDAPLVVYVMQGACGDLQADAECNTPEYSHQKQCPKNRSNDDTK